MTRKEKEREREKKKGEGNIERGRLLTRKEREREREKKKGEILPRIGVIAFNSSDILNSLGKKKFLSIVKK